MTAQTATKEKTAAEKQQDYLFKLISIKGPLTVDNILQELAHARLRQGKPFLSFDEYPAYLNSVYAAIEEMESTGRIDRVGGYDCPAWYMLPKETPAETAPEDNDSEPWNGRFRE